MAKVEAAKTIDIVAGANGSGKTTFADSFFVKQKKSTIYLNPDVIASGISTVDVERASFQAGRVLIKEVKSLIERGESFCFETTLAGRTWFTVLRDAKSQGYAINIYYLYLKNVRINVQRIKQRVQSGGHNIPTEAVRRRYPRSFDNFWNLYRDICSSWHIFDNSNHTPKHILSKSEFEMLPDDEQFSFKTKFLSGKLK